MPSPEPRGGHEAAGISRCSLVVRQRHGRSRRVGSSLVRYSGAARIAASPFSDQTRRMGERHFRRPTATQYGAASENEISDRPADAIMCSTSLRRKRFSRGVQNRS
jgi:hypothetical protein